MTDRTLIKGGIRPHPGPGARRDGRRRRPHRGRPDRRRRARTFRRRRSDDRRHRRHRHPGLHRHPPAYVGDVDPNVRARLRADHLLQRHPRQVRARTTDPTTSTPANLWGSLECINAGITTLVDWSHIMNTPAHADAAIRGLEESQIRSVFAYGFGNTSLVDWWFGPDYTGSVLTIGRTRCPAHPEAVLQLRRPPVTMALATRGTELLQARRRQPRLGAREGARAEHHRPRRDGPVQLHQDADHGPPRHGPALPEHHVRPRLALHRRGMGSCPRLGRQRLVRSADRGPDGPRLGAGGHGARVRPADRPLVRRRHDGTVGPVHPDALDLRRRSAAASTRRHGTPTSMASQPSPGLITSRQVLSWATLGGAQVAGIADRTGSLTPGKKADIVIIDGSAVNVAPIIDPVGRRRLRRGRLERQDGHRRRRDPQGRFPAEGVARRRRARRSRRRATTSSRSSATRSRAGWSRPPRSVDNARPDRRWTWPTQHDHGRHRSAGARPCRVVIVESEGSRLEGRPRHVVGRPDGVPRLRVGCPWHSVDATDGPGRALLSSCSKAVHSWSEEAIARSVLSRRNGATRCHSSS